MAGQLGNETATVLNLEIVEILVEDHAVAIAGALPGPDGAMVIVKHAARPRRRANLAAADA